MSQTLPINYSYKFIIIYQAKCVCPFNTSQRLVVIYIGNRETIFQIPNKIRGYINMPISPNQFVFISYIHTCLASRIF